MPYTVSLQTFTYDTATDTEHFRLILAPVIQQQCRSTGIRSTRLYEVQGSLSVPSSGFCQAPGTVQLYDVITSLSPLDPWCTKGFSALTMSGFLLIKGERVSGLLLGQMAGVNPWTLPLRVSGVIRLSSPPFFSSQSVG